MNRVISKDCPNCNQKNEVNLDDFRGQGLASIDGKVVEVRPIELSDNPIFTPCDYCHYPISLVVEDAE